MYMQSVKGFGTIHRFRLDFGLSVYVDCLFYVEIVVCSSNLS